jgi:hypothetical protein
MPVPAYGQPEGFYPDPNMPQAQYGNAGMMPVPQYGQPGGMYPDPNMQQPQFG